MKNASILYFSGTGNTWWASKCFAEHLRALGFSASEISIETGKAKTYKIISRSDIVFLNYPVYGSDRPEIIKEFISDMPSGLDSDGRKKPLGIICTQMMFSGDGAWLEHDLIENKGYQIQWALHLPMPNNISVPEFPFKFSNDRNKINSILKKADSSLKNLAESVIENKPQKQGTSGFSRVLGLMQRNPYRKMLPKLRDDVTIDPFTCSKCGKCIRLCPVENIRFADDKTGGFPEFQGHCILCLRCYNFCPSQSVLYRTKKFKPGSGVNSIPYSGPTVDFDPFLLKESK